VGVLLGDMRNGDGSPRRGELRAERFVRPVWANECSPSFLRSKWRTNVRQWECHPRDVRPPLPLAATKACGQGDGCASRSFALLRKPNVDPYVTTFRMCIRTYTHRGSTSDCISVSVLVIQLMLILFTIFSRHFVALLLENLLTSTRRRVATTGQSVCVVVLPEGSDQTFGTCV
jgi:hypothetical protein